MTHPLRAPIRHFALVMLTALLAACASVPSPKGFSPAQVAALQSEGFVESGDEWALTINERLLFPVDQSALLPEQIERLGALAQHLVAVDIPTARIEGHTDSTGSSAYNQTLSEARARVVAAALQSSGMRFTPEQIIGRGETIPLSPNDTAQGRQDNRRVVIVVTPAA